MEVVVFEESDCFGGISRTVEYKGNRMDMGGHRFFSKIPEVNAWWDQMLPMQGAPSYDDTVLDREVPLQKNGPVPGKRRSGHADQTSGVPVSCLMISSMIILSLSRWKL